MASARPQTIFRDSSQFPKTGNGAENRSGVTRFSPVREPWRWLRPSMVVQFSTAKSSEWSPDRLPPQTRNDILSALEARWASHLAYAQLKMAIFDLTALAKKLPSYQEVSPCFPTTDQDIHDLLRRMASMRGELSLKRREIRYALAQLESLRKEIDLFAEATLEIREQKSGDVIIKFNESRSKMTCEEVRVKAQQYCCLLNNCRDVICDAKKQIMAQ